MTPQLVGFDRGPQPHLVVVTPSLGLIGAKAAKAHAELALPPGTRRVLALGMEVGDAYDAVVRHLLGQWPECKWMLTLEDDNLPPADGYWRLRESIDAMPWISALSGLYRSKGRAEHGTFHIWGDPAISGDFASRDPVDRYMECNAISMGFSLWRMSMFDDPALRRPWFLTTDGSTQDIHFWRDARQHGYRCAVDCEVHVGHYDIRGRHGPPDTIY